MRQIWDFHGGIHPPENKQQSTATPIRQTGVAPQLILPLSQHIGQPAKPVVAVGDRVLKGQLIAEAAGPVSVAVHAPSSGTVTGITDHRIPHPSGLSDTCIFIDTDGEDTWIPLKACEDYQTLEPSEILRRVRGAGIAGLGGAGFPTAIKLHPPRNDKVNALILNAAECEPYITADDMLMREYASEIVGGLEIMAYLLEPEECLIGIEDNKPEAIAALREAVSGTNIEVVVIPTKYPSGGEKQLIRVLTGLEVPHNSIPADIGVMCQNVGTARAVYRAIRFGEPLISRITTLTGEALSTQGNVETLIGTPIDWLLENAGFDPQKAERVLMGGPMMGFTLPDTHLPVIKTTNCILAASAAEFPEPEPEQPCIRCGLCAEACPAELLPQQLFWFAKAQEFEKAEMYSLFDCIECGACSYVCPSSIPLVQYYRYAKAEVRTARLEQQKSDRARERFEFRQARLQREQEEKEARRKARAEAAAKAQAEKAASQDPKKAAVEEAVKRAQAKRAAPSAETQLHSQPDHQKLTQPDLQELENNVRKAQDKLTKVEESLQQAEAEQSEMAGKLRNAVAKNRERLQAAEQALENARQQTDNASAGASSPADDEQIQRAIKRQRDKIATLEKAISDSRESDPERAEQLSASLSKSQDKLNELLKQSGSSQTETATQAPQADFNALQDQVDKATDKLAMMQNMLDEARNEVPVDEGKVAKLSRAVAKNEERLQAARDNLEKARSAEATAAATTPGASATEKPVPEAPAAETPDVEQLQNNLEKARDKLEMMLNMLEEARGEDPVDDSKVAKLTRAVDKNRERLAAAEKALADAEAVQ